LFFGSFSLFLLFIIWELSFMFGYLLIIDVTCITPFFTHNYRKLSINHF
jgi:hypothetical protein